MISTAAGSERSAILGMNLDVTDYSRVAEEICVRAQR